MISRHLVRSSLKNLPISRSLIMRETDRWLKKRKSPQSLVEIEIVGQRKIATLNSKFMGKNGPTDVLSFPLKLIPGENKRLIGTVVLCSDIINKQAELNGTSFGHEFVLRLEHGLDHLLGKHHK